MTKTQLLTVREAANLAGCSEKTISDLARRRKLAAHKEGKYWRIELASAERYREERATRGTLPILEDPDALEKLYREHGTLQAVADQIGSNKNRVGHAMRKHGLQVQTRRDAATPPFIPRPVSLKRWQDLAPIYLARGLRPPKREEMCPRNCPGWGECLNTEGCVMVDQGGNGNGGSP